MTRFLTLESHTLLILLTRSLSRSPSCHITAISRSRLFCRIFYLLFCSFQIHSDTVQNNVRRTTSTNHDVFIPIRLSNYINILQCLIMFRELLRRERISRIQPTGLVCLSGPMMFLQYIGVERASWIGSYVTILFRQVLKENILA